MTLTNYKQANNATSTLASGISAGATSFVCATGQGGRFPSTFPFLVTIEQTVSSVVTKREIVKVTNRVADAFTIVRSADYCLLGDTATTQTNTAQSFLSGDTISERLTATVIDDLNAELARLETAKIDKAGGTYTGLVQGAKSANIASATTTNLATATGNEVHITGTTTITAFGTLAAGTVMTLIFDGILTLTHNATSLILPNGGNNIITSAGDTCIFMSEGSGNWKCTSYETSSGQKSNTIQTYTPSGAGTATIDLSKGNIHHITMPSGNITIAISNPTIGQCFMIRILQDGTGSRTVTWFTTIKWASGGTAPTLTATANKADTFGFEITGSGTYDGFTVGVNI